MERGKLLLNNRMLLMNILKNIAKRIVSLSLVLFMMIALLPAITVPVSATTSGTVTGLSNADISATYTGTDDGSNSSWSATGGNSIKGSVVGTAGMCSDSHYDTTLTITNSKSTAAVLMFDYTIAVNDGTIQVDGSNVISNGSYSNTIAAGASIKIYLRSGSTDNATTINITNLNLIADVNVDVTFQPGENGTYTIDGDTINGDTVISGHKSTTPFALVATPNSGYKFIGWYSTAFGIYLSDDSTASLYIDSEQIIKPIFVEDTTPVFDVSGIKFTDLNEANNYAVSNGIGKITLISDGVLPAGEYTISNGVILLIPFDEAGTCYTTAPATTGNIRTSPSVYRQLTMEEGASISVDGAISVSAKHYAYSQGGASGAPDGKYGYIFMNEGSSITINSGGAMYVYGFVSGKGEVTAKSGATIYENMQIADFRGGSATIKMNNNSQKIFPINQYFVQNIEVKLTLESGADEYVYTSIYASSMSTSTSVHFIGNSGAMFSVADGGYFTKEYLSDQDRLEVSVNGDAGIQSLTLTLNGISISSSNYVLPINNCMTININSGTTKITQDVALLAGSQVNIAEDATLNITSGSSMYVYDQDEWTQANYASNAKFKRVPYSPTRTYTRTNNDLIDAKIDINGILLADGYVYTTAGGANITSSSGNGTFVLTNGAGNATATYMYKDYTTTYDTIPVTSAKLHNDAKYDETDEKYTTSQNSPANSTYYYDNVERKWKLIGSADVVVYTITFDGNGVEGIMDSQTFNQGSNVSLNINTFTSDGYEFLGWNTASNGSGTSFADGASLKTVSFDSAEVTLYAQWKFMNGWLSDDIGKQYYQNGEVQKTGWTTIDSKVYYLDPKTGYAATSGLHWLPYPEGYGPDTWDENNNENYVLNGYDTNSYFYFDADGVFQSSMTGIYTLDQGTAIYGKTDYTLDTNMVVYLDQGELPWHPGLVFDNGDYYYFPTDYFEDDSTDTLVKGKDYYISKTNDLILPTEFGEGIFTKGKYTFDGDGKLLLRDGFVIDGDVTYYYTKGAKTYAGLIKIGEDYYYINSSCIMIAGQDYVISKTNGLLPQGKYTFDADGKMIRENTSLNGIVKEEDGTWYYYINGVKTYAGLIEIDGAYYYVNSSFQVIHDRNYFISKTNGLLSNATYEFDSNGKLILPDKGLNGIIKEEDGTWYYYIEGVKTYAGLIEIDGAYYYVNSSFQVIHDQSYFISKTNNLLPQGTYVFDEDGKMIRENASLNGIVKEEDGTWYYYINGVKTYAGLIELDGAYYYVNSSFQVIHDRSYFISKTNGLLPNATYTFDADGKIIL